MPGYYYSCPSFYRLPYRMYHSFFSNAYQLIGVKPFWNLCEDLVGNTVLAFSGKRAYYEKKRQYFEAATRSIEQGGAVGAATTGTIAHNAL